MEDTLKDRNLYIILNTPINSKSMSGGDKIFIKISEILASEYGYKINFIGCPDGINLVKNSTKSIFKYYQINNISGEGRNLFLTYILRLLLIYNVLFLKIEKNSYVISASDFITDTFALFVLRIKYGSGIKAYSSMFLRKEISNNLNVKDILFLLSQVSTLFLTKIFKLKIFTNQIDREFLKKKGISSSNIIILPGGVEEVKIENLEKIYDACFVGRISFQKGTDILLEILKSIIKTKHNFKLALIVSGTVAEISNLKSEISANNLDENIQFLGFLDNQAKYEVISRSKMMIFPSRYESFGIVVAESLNLKVPVVAFGLEALKLNFTNGILYSKNSQEFTDNIKLLLSDKKLIYKLGIEGKKCVERYNWRQITHNFFKDLV